MSHFGVDDSMYGLLNVYTIQPYDGWTIEPGVVHVCNDNNNNYNNYYNLYLVISPSLHSIYSNNPLSHPTVGFDLSFLYFIYCCNKHLERRQDHGLLSRYEISTIDHYYYYYYSNPLMDNTSTVALSFFLSILTN